MKLLYFAWLRERIGLREEVAEPPATVSTVGDLMAWLRGRGEGYAAAFEHEGVIRAAIDQVHAGREASVVGAREVAFFPPMTGG